MTTILIIAILVALIVGFRAGVHLATISIHHHAAENLDPAELPEFRRLMDKTLENDR